MLASEGRFLFHEYAIYTRVGFETRYLAGHPEDIDRLSYFNSATKGTCIAASSTSEPNSAPRAPDGTEPREVHCTLTSVVRLLMCLKDEHYSTVVDHSRDVLGLHTHRTVVLVKCWFGVAPGVRRWSLHYD